MITKIKLDNVASYNNSVEILDLKKVNFFFGYNGTGKSTIGRLFYNESLEDDNKSDIFSNCLIEGFNKDTHDILVYNQEFISRNFIEKDKLKGIFSLNEQNDEIEQQIQLINDKKTAKEIFLNETLVKLLDKNQQRIKSKENELLQFCFTKRLLFKDFHKIPLKHSGSKKRFVEEIRNLLSQVNENDITISELTQGYERYFENEITKITKEIGFEYFFQILKIESKINTLLSEIIIGNNDVDIANLIDELNISSWVDEGRKTIKEDICPFCQKKTIDQSFKSKLEQYFDKTYLEKKNEISNILTQYNQLKTALISKLQELTSDYNIDNSVSNLHADLTTFFNNNIKEIEEKLLKTNERKSITSIKNFYIRFLKINYNLITHNQEVDNIESHRNELIDKIWLYMAKECLSEIADSDNEILKINKLVERINNSKERTIAKISTFNSNIVELRQTTINTSDAVESINNTLELSGFTGFTIKETVGSENTYYLDREGSNNVFKSLSEGEKNFIAFLYFSETCKGNFETENNKKKILIIDDPVSSMDNQILFIVSTLIQKLIRQKGSSRPEKRELENQYLEQIFILSHNVYFYKEVSLDFRPICLERNHYHITKLGNDSHIETKGQKCFIKNDYFMLWDSLKNLKNENNSLHKITIYNTMRRILESYASFIGHGSDSWSSISDIDSSTPSFNITSALISEINDASHGVYPLDNLYYQRIHNASNQDLFDSFEIIFNTLNQEHYNKMMID
ncbi:MAG: AAA family ATPase [Flavobacteriales bacterium]|jgi:wobble nucleotide-excising tRNase|nr:AAA family ATPase [Flavobacteriales bacterium]